jgi:hypothetical protein
MRWGGGSWFLVFGFFILGSGLVEREGLRVSRLGIDPFAVLSLFGLRIGYEGLSSFAARMQFAV